jgi:antitoxin component YwqK of YwqJK toxin-antitoxin module
MTEGFAVKVNMVFLLYCVSSMKNRGIAIFVFILLFLFNAAAQTSTGKNITAKNKTVNGKKEGQWIEYFDVSANPTSDSATADYYRLAFYRKGILNGTVRYYDKGGKMYKETPYTNGKENGSEKEYRGNGTVSREINFRLGEVLTIKTYYKSGKIQADILYKDGYPYLDRRYDEKGSLTGEAKYPN